MWIKRTAALLFVLAAVVAAAAGAASAPAQYTVAGHQLLVYQPNGKPRGRIILLHGYASSARITFSDPLYANMVNEMVGQGWQVVAPDLPDTDESLPDSRVPVSTDLYDGSEGADYIAKWQSEFVSVRGWADRRYGKLPVYVGGVSWGGFHALYAACHNQIDGWFTLLPVTNPMLMEEYAHTDLSKMTLAGCAQKLAQKPGLIVFGLADMRVSGTATQTFARSILAFHKKRLAVKVYPDLQHEGTPQNVADVVAWTKSRVP